MVISSANWINSFEVSAVPQCHPATPIHNDSVLTMRQAFHYLPCVVPSVGFAARLVLDLN